VRSLSTHVLDAVTGEPAAGVGVVALPTGRRRLDRARGGDHRRRRARPRPRARTGLADGDHRLVFDTAAHFAATGHDGFYPEVAVVFTVSQERHLHVPLLLSPYAYSTYRGS
jgi:5-hydroxyisourate hydrolase